MAFALAFSRSNLMGIGNVVGFLQLKCIITYTLRLYRKNLVKEVSKYLKYSFGFNLDVEDYADASSWPAFLERAADYYLYAVNGARFVIASIPGNATLPKLKRVFCQADKRVGMTIVLTIDSIDARQRKALIQQSIPFIVPDKQIFLPLLGFFAVEKIRRSADCVFKKDDMTVSFSLAETVRVPLQQIGVTRCAQRDS